MIIHPSTISNFLELFDNLKFVLVKNCIRFINLEIDSIHSEPIAISDSVMELRDFRNTLPAAIYSEDYDLFYTIYQFPDFTTLSNTFEFIWEDQNVEDLEP